MNSTYAAGVLALLSCAEHVVLYAAGCRVTVRLLAHLVVPDLHCDLLHHMLYFETTDHSLERACSGKRSAIKLLN